MFLEIDPNKCYSSSEFEKMMDDAAEEYRNHLMNDPSAHDEAVESYRQELEEEYDLALARGQIYHEEDLDCSD